MELRAEEFNVEILHKAHCDNPVTTRLEVRWDPPTGHTARVLPPSGLMVPQRYDLTSLADETRAHCPFCSERIDAAVPRFPSRIVREGRIRVGDLVTERRLGRRWLGELGGIEWLTAFAPVAPGDVRAFLPGVSSPAELAPEQVEALGAGMCVGLGLYAELGFESFNMALYGARGGLRGTSSTSAWCAAQISSRSIARTWPGRTASMERPLSTSSRGTWPTGPRGGSARSIY